MTTHSTLFAGTLLLVASNGWAQTAATHPAEETGQQWVGSGASTASAPAATTPDQPPSEPETEAQEAADLRANVQAQDATIGTLTTQLAEARADATKAQAAESTAVDDTVDKAHLKARIRLLGDAQAALTAEKATSASFGGGIDYWDTTTRFTFFARAGATENKVEQDEFGSFLLLPTTYARPSFELSGSYYSTKKRRKKANPTEEEVDSDALFKFTPGVEGYLIGGSAPWHVQTGTEADGETPVFQDYKALVVSAGLAIGTRRVLVLSPENFVATYGSLGLTSRFIGGDVAQENARLQAALKSDRELYWGPEARARLEINQLGVDVRLSYITKDKTIDGFTGMQLLVMADLRDGPTLLAGK